MEATFIYAGSPVDGEVNSSTYRVITPAKYLRKLGHTINTAGGESQGPEHIESIDYTNIRDTVLIERHCSPDVVRKLRDAGAKKIILTFDDHYGSIPKNLDSWKYWHGSKPSAWEIFQKSLSLVDCVLVSSEKLRIAFYNLCKKIEVVDNFLDPDLWSIPEENHGPKTVIGWGGSLGHTESWRDSGVCKGLRLAQDRYGDLIEIRIFGKSPVKFLDDACVKYTYNSYVSFYDWPKEVSQFDIGLAPLHGEYDSYRSSLKVCEYGLFGIPYIATQLEPYIMDEKISRVTSRREFCPGIYSEGTYNSWYNNIVNIIENLDKFRDASHSWSGYFRNMYLADRNMGIYERILWSD